MVGFESDRFGSDGGPLFWTPDIIDRAYRATDVLSVKFRTAARELNISNLTNPFLLTLAVSSELNHIDPDSAPW